LLHRLQTRRILWRSEGRKWVLRAPPPLKISLYRLYQSRILRKPQEGHEFSGFYTTWNIA
jgi:hypothetical protein